MGANDQAWETVFSQTRILDEINTQGWANISADQLKQIGKREPRLLAKMDTMASRPEIFRKQDLVILPVTNGHYVVFRDSDRLSYRQIPEPQGEATVYQSQRRLEGFETYPRLADFSESQAIDFAFISSLLKTAFVEKEMFLTIRGRLRSNEFTLTLPPGNSINVSGVQIEVDAGFEGERIYLVEAKIGRRDDFHIRQLYYPFLNWSQVCQKPVIPVFLTYSNGKYTLTCFEFGKNYGELAVTFNQSFVINDVAVAELSIARILEQTTRIAAPPEIPFPQANDMDKVVDTVGLANEGELTKMDVTSFFEFDERQGDYYLNAGAYLGFLSRHGQHFRITPLGCELLKHRTVAERTAFIVRRLCQLPTFREAIALWSENGCNVDSVNRLQLQELIMRNAGLNEVTAGRRSSTVIRWLRWIEQNTRRV